MANQRSVASLAASAAAVRADFNGDSKPDFVLYNASTRRTAIWYLNNNALVTGAYGPTLPVGWRVVTVADFNGDGKPDFVLYNTSTGQTAIWYLYGASFVRGAYGPTLPSGWTLMSVGDFNGDSKPDFVLYNASTRRTAIWYLNNNALVTGAYGPTLPVGWRVVTVADFNGDGKPDFVLYNASTRQTAIWYLSGASFVRGAYGPTLPSGWTLMSVGDFNADSKPDFVLYNASTRRTAIWYLNNNAFVGGAYGPTLPVGWNLIGPDLTPISLIGAFNFPGPYPPISEVAYTDKSGQTLSTVAYSGQVFCIVSPTAMNASAASQLIQTNGGTVIAQIPTAGIYWAQVASGLEGSFITAVYTNPSVIYAAPNVPLTPSQTSVVDLSGTTSTIPLIPNSGCLIAQFDWFGDLPVNDVCGLSHGFAANNFLTQNGQCTGIYDITAGGQVVLGTPSDVGFGILRAAEGARIPGQKLIVNASMQSGGAPNDGVDRSYCETNPFAGICSCQGIPALPDPPCSKSPNSNYESWKSNAFQTLANIAAELEFQRDDLLDNTMVVVSAGNGGLDMTINGIDLIKIFFPKAFAHMIIVGALDSNGQPYPGFNHSTNPTHMLYAPGINVVVPGTGGCLTNGTSFSAPAVTNLAAQLAHAFPTLTSAQLVTAIQNAAPIVSGGLRAIPTFQVAANQVKTLSITTSGTGIGTVTANPTGLAYLVGTNVTLTAIPASGSTFAGWSGDASGTGTAVVIMDADKSVTATFNLSVLSPSIVITSVVSTITDHNSLWTDYSVTVRGTTTGTPYYYSYQAGWGIFGLIDATLSSSPEYWSFTFNYTEFAGPPTVIPIWAEEYDGSGSLVASDYRNITLSY